MKLANKILLLLLLAFAPCWFSDSKEYSADCQTKTIQCAQEKWLRFITTSTLPLPPTANFISLMPAEGQAPA